MTVCRRTLAVILMLIPAATLQAQNERGGGRGGVGANLPAVGTTLPSVTAYDEAGREFSLDSLRGHYSVLVFGCLT